MSMINEITEQTIKTAARIDDVLRDGLSVHLKRDGANFQAFCPFHEDKHIGSFKVSLTKNICTCFSCGKTWTPINALMDGLHIDYPTALRWLAAKYNIYIDDEPVPMVKPSEPRKEPEPLEMIYWSAEEIVKHTLHHDESNPLLQYLTSLPLDEVAKYRLRVMTELYMVGTSIKGDTQGWTIWWQMDEDFRVRTGKLMKYLPNGHRDREAKYSFNFVHSMLLKLGRWDNTTHEYRGCLFGQHLLNAFPKAEICLVESEKSALICSMFSDPRERLWMATCGKSGLKRRVLQPLIDQKRDIVLFPDIDGYQEWSDAMRVIGYPRMQLSKVMKSMCANSCNGKDDIADIMLRRMVHEETTADKASRLLGLEKTSEKLAYMIEKLGLELKK